MFWTNMELWEAERRYQAGVTEHASFGLDGPGLTSLADEQVSAPTNHCKAFPADTVLYSTYGTQDPTNV